MGKADKCGACYYCGLPFIRMRHEHDHAPVPRRCDGSKVVQACLTCHEMKDRTLLWDWPMELFAAAMTELQVLGIVPDPLHPAATFPTEWGLLAPMSRVLWAKLTSIGHDWGPEPRRNETAEMFPEFWTFGTRNNQLIEESK